MNVSVRSFYGKCRNLIPQRLKGIISKQVFAIGLKPSINKSKKSPFKKGIIVFSADFEMAWAFRYSKTLKNKAVEIGLQERENFTKLLMLFEKHKIPVSWATVGHLFLKECSCNEAGFAHHELPRPSYFENRNWHFETGDWYENDPCGNYKTYPAWYAPDLIDLIIASSVKHEIACHTFSHCDFSYKNCTPELAKAEISKCKELALQKGIELKSMVFPGGTFGNYETLKEQDFTCYRFPMANHIDIPFIDKHGLVAIPSSLGLDKDPYNWSEGFHLKMIDSYLKKTTKSKQVCHFWFHPSMDPWYLKNVLPFILENIEILVKRGDIEVLTMEVLAEKYKKIVND